MVKSSSRYGRVFEEPSTQSMLVEYTRNRYFLGGIVLFIIFMFTTDASFIFGPLLGSHSKKNLPNSLLSIDYPYTLLENVVMDQPVETTDVAFFWNPHKSDEQIVQKVLMNCYGIEVIELDSLEAINNARADHLSSRKDKNFAISSPYLREAIEVFTPEHMGRMGCFFRHPLDYDFHQSLSFEDTDNWLVRYLLDQREGPLGYRQLGTAKQIVRNFCVVSTMDKIEESIKRMAAYFGWELQASETCVDDIVGVESPEERYADHESSEWKSFYNKNIFDCQIYELVQSTWRAQIQTIVPLQIQMDRFRGVKHSEED